MIIKERRNKVNGVFSNRSSWLYDVQTSYIDGLILKSSNSMRAQDREAWRPRPIIPAERLYSWLHYDEEPQLIH